MDYMEMLKKARSKIPQSARTERISIPRPAVIQSGRQTIVQNFQEICKTIRRDPKHVAKFLFKELAVPGSIRENTIMLQGKFSQNVIEKRMDDYVKDFVLCRECGKIDTNLEKTGSAYTLKCESCGAKKTMK